ncbi:hypothetical protein J5Y03_15170 [Bacillus sp. RG28]|uniref:Uncharacterized protein n=1 Tax=Gottfriedia endophytica TaxID=2820819 RepID=A0A940SJY2_9BACI|nr:hypothetical protein [Gottfriedia endophytica]MBP0726500.1 hypothetical protein [Gottfriedia endophytica]
MALVYSTGPMENVFNNPQSFTVLTAVLNNHKHKTITAKIEVFKLNGKKILIDSATLTIAPGSSFFHLSDVSKTTEFEIQIGISPSNDPDDVLIGVFGRDANTNLVAAHRVVHKELTRID